MNYKRICASFVLFVSCVTAGYSQITYDKIIAENKKLGLVGYLVAIKGTTETKLRTLEFQHSEFSKIDKSLTGTALTTKEQQIKTNGDKLEQYRTEYLVIKTFSDALLNQLNADMYVKNRLGVYKSVNKHVRKGSDVKSKFSHFQVALGNIDALAKGFQNNSYSSMAAAPSFEAIVGAVELVHTMISEARAFRQTKIDAVTKVLELCKLKDLEAKKEEEEKK